MTTELLLTRKEKVRQLLALAGREDWPSVVGWLLVVLPDSNIDIDFKFKQIFGNNFISPTT